MKRKHWIRIGIAAIIVVLLIVWQKPGKEKSDDALYTTTALTRGNIENTVSATGALSALETVEVGAQVSGIIEKLLVDFNSSVTKGQLLAVLDKTPFRVSVQEAQARVDSAAAELERLETELERNRPLFENGHISQTEFLQWKTQAATARANLKSAQATLKRARTNLGYTEIRSPMDGTVIERTVDEGQTIAASFQAPKLFLIARDLTKMQIEALVDESDIGLIRQGQQTRFSVQSYPDRRFTGTVRQIRLQPTTINNVVNYTVVVDAENRDRVLLPGMTATVDFLVEYKENVLMVPNSALNLRPSEGIEIERTQAPDSATANSGKAVPSATGAPENTRKQMGYVFVPLEKEKLRIVFFRKGATDASHTEIAASRELEEGTRVVTKFTNPPAASNNNRRNPFMMGGPPRGGRPR
ncbi:MAG TPA: efflux RND transporter periplasmic adaptor subunit [Candidatus Aminicenantes bacterium]|nr:efflux RND transporter periplasmic adaptor subunit [Candidatus Aminicenantes bacterium]